MIGMSQYAKWVGTPEGATAILKAYRPLSELEAQTASSHEPKLTVDGKVEWPTPQPNNPFSPLSQHPHRR